MLKLGDRVMKDPINFNSYVLEDHYNKLMDFFKDKDADVDCTIDVEETLSYIEHKRNAILKEMSAMIYIDDDVFTSFTDKIYIPRLGVKLKFYDRLIEALEEEEDPRIFLIYKLGGVIPFFNEEANYIKETIDSSIDFIDIMQDSRIANDDDFSIPAQPIFKDELDFCFKAFTS